jgi:lysophospholipase L1-like esterase
MSLPAVFVVGDSISLQYGPYLEGALRDSWSYARKTGEAAALADLDVPRGSNGGDSTMVLAWLRAVIAGLSADLLLVNCGLHDIKRPRPGGACQVGIDAYRVNLQEIVTCCVERQQDLAWIRSTPCDEAVHNPRADFDRFAADLNAYNEVADQVMLENGIPMIDLHNFTANLGGAGIYCDHVHFTEEVRARQAAFLAGWLDAWLACRLR